MGWICRFPISLLNTTYSFKQMGWIPNYLFIPCTILSIIDYKEIFDKGVCHTGALPFTFLKKYLEANVEELWKLKYFTMQKY
jgi:hypothetical protein